jgi:DNA-binding CsgD family transcriptional regulator
MCTEAYEQTCQQIAIGLGISPEVMETHAGRRITTQD